MEKVSSELLRQKGNQNYGEPKKNNRNLQRRMHVL